MFITISFIQKPSKLILPSHENHNWVADISGLESEVSQPFDMLRFMFKDYVWSTISPDWNFDSCKYKLENWILTQLLLKSVALCQLSSWLYCWNLLYNDVTYVFKSLSLNKNFVTIIICQISFLLISSKSQLRPDPLCEFLYKSEDYRMWNAWWKSAGL